MGYLKSIGTAFIYITFSLAVITFLPGLPPDVTFSEYSIKWPNRLSGKLDINSRLNGVELLHVGRFKGPEAFDSYNGELYVGLDGGSVVKINENEVIPFVKFGGNCDQILKYHECGKVLGMKFDKKGNLYFIDTYMGIFKSDLKGNFQKIIDISKPINNKVPQLPNSIDVAENGDIFWTDSNSDFQLYDAALTFLANPSGRLIRYNAATKTNEVLIKNLMFANGVKLSKDQSFLLVVETLASRIIKYHLKGAKAGQYEILYEGLPGMPDNIQEDNNGGFLISLFSYVDQENPSLLQTLMPHPYLRKMILRLLTIIRTPFKLIQNVYPNFYTERMIHAIGSLETYKNMLLPNVVVLNLDATGKLVDAAYSNDEKMRYLSSAFIHNEYLWLGSPFNEFVARVPLKQAFPHLAQTEKILHRSKQQGTKESSKTDSTTIKPQIVETPSTVSTGKSSKATTTKPSTATTTAPTTTRKPSTTTTAPTTTGKPSTTTKAPTTTGKPSTTTKAPTTTGKPSTTTKAPTTTGKPSTTTTTASTTTGKPSTTTTTASTTTGKPSTTTTKTTASTTKSVPTTTTVKPSTKSVPTTTTTTVKPSTASTTQTPKTTTTKPVVKQSGEAATKPNNKELKLETVKPVEAKPNTPADSTKQNVKETRPEINKQTVQDSQAKAKKQVQTPGNTGNESPKTATNNNNNNNIPK